MPIGVNEVQIVQVKNHWEVHINGAFYCSADSYNEAVKELRKDFG